MLKKLLICGSIAFFLITASLAEAKAPKNDKEKIKLLEEKVDLLIDQNKALTPILENITTFMKDTNNELDNLRDRIAIQKQQITLIAQVLARTPIPSSSTPTKIEGKIQVERRLTSDDLLLNMMNRNNR